MMELNKMISMISFIDLNLNQLKYLKIILLKLLLEV